jgi:importin-5
MYVFVCAGVIDDERERYEEEGNWEFIPLGDRQVAIKTSILEQKSQACNMLYCYVEQLEEGYFPYVDQTAKLFVPLLCFYYHDGVRSAAALTMPCLLQSTKKYLAQVCILSLCVCVCLVC